jgi:hypothetical protein
VRWVERGAGVLVAVGAAWWLGAAGVEWRVVNGMWLRWGELVVAACGRAMGMRRAAATMAMTRRNGSRCPGIGWVVGFPAFMVGAEIAGCVDPGERKQEARRDTVLVLGEDR